MNESIRAKSNAAGQSGSVPRWLAYAASFWGGFTVMVLEISGFRVLPTYLGSSVIVTGTLLTAFMILMSLGYYAGGLSSTRPRGTSWLFAALIFASLYTFVVSGQLFEGLAALVMSWRTALPAIGHLQDGSAAGLLTIGLYGPPVIALSAMSPHWIRLGSAATGDDAGAAGRETGRFMSLATVGSIAGTVAGSFALVPLLGVTLSASLVAVVLFILSLLGWLKLQSFAPSVGAASPASEAL